MCHSCTTAAAIDEIDEEKMRAISQKIVALFKNDVNLIIFQINVDESQKPKWESIWEYASDGNTEKPFSHNADLIASSISSTENAIHQLNIGPRVDEPIAYRLICHGSRIYTRILGQNKRRLVIICKFQEPGQNNNQNSLLENEIDSKLKEYAEEYQRTLNPLPSAHNEV